MPTVASVLKCTIIFILVFDTPNNDEKILHYACCKKTYVMHIILGKEIQVPHFLKIEPPVSEDRFVWQKMARRITQYRASQVTKALDDCQKEQQLPTFADMKSILMQQDSRIPEFYLYRLAYKWCESQRLGFLKKRLSFIDFSRINVEKSRLVEIEPALRSGDITDSSSFQVQKWDDFSNETRTFIEKFAVQKNITAKYVLQNPGEIFQLFESLDSHNSRKLDVLDDYIAALVVYLRQHDHDSSELDLLEIVCSLGKLRYEYVFSEFVKDVNFARLSPLQRKLAHVDLAPLEKRHVLRVDNALHQSRILSHADIAQLQGMFAEHVHRWVMYYADDQCDQSRWKQLNDILETDVFKMIVFRFRIDAHDWVIAVCIAEKLTLRDTVAVNKQSKCRSQIFVSVHDQNNDSCLTSLADNYFLALDGHRLQIFVDNPKKDRTATFVCLMNLEDSGDSVGMSVALNRFHRPSFSKDHNGAKIRRQEVSRFEVFLNQPTPMVAPAIIVGHYDDYRLLQNIASTSTSPPSPDFQFSARAFPRLDEEPALSVSDLEEECQKIGLEYYQIMQRIAMKQPVENEIRDWMTRLQHASSEEVKYRILVHVTVGNLSKSQRLCITHVESIVIGILNCDFTYGFMLLKMRCCLHIAQVKIERAYRLEEILAELQTAVLNADSYMLITSVFVRHPASFATIVR